MDKASAMRRVNRCLGHELLMRANTRFSNVNGSRSRPVPVWWFTIDSELFKSDLHLLLAKDSGLIWMVIEANAFSCLGRIFKKRADGKIDLEISCDVRDRFMCDIRNGGAGYSFLPHVKQKYLSGE